MANTMIQQTVQTQLGSSLFLSSNILGAQCYSDLKKLFQTADLQLKKLPIDFHLKKGDLLTFNGELIVPNKQNATSTFLDIQFCLFDIDSERQAVLQIGQSISTYLTRINAPFKLDTSVANTMGSYFDFYIKLRGTSTTPYVIYSSMGHETFSPANTTPYQDYFNSIVPMAHFKIGLNFPIDCTFEDDAATYLAQLIDGTNKAISPYGAIGMKTNDLEQWLQQGEASASASQLSSLQSQAYLFVEQEFNASISVFADALKFTLNTVGLGFPLVNQGAIAPEVTFDATAMIDQYTLSVQLDLLLYQRLFLIKFKDFPTLKQVLNLFSLDASSYFSSPFDVLLEVQLSSLEITFDPIQKTVLEINLSVTAGHEIEIIEGIVNVQPTLTLQIQNPGDHNNQLVQGAFLADWMLGSSKFEVSLSYPQFNFMAELATGQTLDIDAVVSGIFDGVSFPNISIHSLSVDGNYFENNFNFKLDVESDLNVPLLGGDLLRVEQVQMGMTYDHGQKAYALMGLFQLAHIPINVSASYDEKNWQFKGLSFPIPTISFKDFFAALPGNDEAITLVNKVAGLLPSLSIANITFDYNRSDHSFTFQTQVDWLVNESISSTPLNFTLLFERQKIEKGFAWMLEGNSQFTAPITLADVMSSVIQTFGISDSIPASITSLDLSISALSFSYNTASAEFDFGFTLDKPAAFSGITGNDISNDKSKDKSPPQSFTAFHVTRTKTEQHTKTVLTIKINAGLQLDDLLDLKGDLPATLNPTLDEINFSITLDASKAGGNVSASKDFRFSTTFTELSHQFEFRGAFNEVTQGSTTTKIFGGNMYSPSGGTLDMGSSFPINLGLNDVFIAKVSTTTVGGSAESTSFSTFGSDLTIDAHFDLSSLPVVGGFLTDAKFSFNALRFTYLKPSISSPNGIGAKQLAVINGFLQEINVAPLVTAQSSVNNKNGDKANFPSGYSLQGSLVLGENAMTIPLHTAFAPTATGNTGNGETGHENTGNGSSYSSPSTASAVGKKFGPVTIDSVGLGMRDGGLGLKFIGGLTLGPVEFDFIGFEITSSITHFDPDITLNGLGVDIHKGALALEGLMMKGDIDIPAMDYSTGQVTTEIVKAYTGALTVGYQQYNLAALGSYGQLPDGSTTMFMYGFLGAPLGGIPILYISGVAAGFGYNRTFNLPAPTEISNFPLIQPVMDTPPAGTSSQAEDFAAMNKDFLPKEGAFWGAIGLRVESFKMVESFVLLDVQFNDTLEVDLIGISNMTFPTPAEGDATHPLAKIIIGIEARIRPEQGILTIDGAFQPGTYILDPSAHITGGFGMLSVFTEQTSGSYKGAKEGDFIFSIGGYPSHYAVASYYPSPQRLGFNWQVSPIQSIKGSAYFAIVPEAMMAGGALENLYNIGGPLDIKASFILGADFIIYWKPYHYSADVSLEIDVCASLNVDCWLFSIHLDFNMDLGADLQVWGPPFAGKGYLTVHSIITFSVDVSFGDVVPTPIPISWSEFCNSFLPVTDNILTAAVGSGLLATVEHMVNGEMTKIDVVNPKEVSVACHTAFPLKSVTTSTGEAVDGTSTTHFGIAPMAKMSGDIDSSLKVTITKGMSKINVEGDFNYRLLTRNLPSAMWQAAEAEGTLPSTQGRSLISDLACGVEIKPKPQGAESPFTITSPGEEIIRVPNAEAVSAFTYGASNFSMTAYSGA